MKLFFRHKFVARECACGEALGFKVAQMLQFVKVKDGKSVETYKEVSQDERELDAMV